jgi:hypothetical protein
MDMEAAIVALGNLFIIIEETWTLHQLDHSLA